MTRNFSHPAMKMKGCAAPDIMNERGDGNKRVAMETREFQFLSFSVHNGLTDFGVLALSRYISLSSSI